MSSNQDCTGTWNREPTVLWMWCEHTDVKKVCELCLRRRSSYSCNDTPPGKNSFTSKSFSPSQYYQCESLSTGMQQQPPLAHEAKEENWTANTAQLQLKDKTLGAGSENNTFNNTQTLNVGWVWARSCVHLHCERYWSLLRTILDLSCTLWFLQSLSYQSASSTFLYMIKPFWQSLISPPKFLQLIIFLALGSEIPNDDLDEVFNFNCEHKLNLQLLVVINSNFKPCVAPTSRKHVFTSWFRTVLSWEFKSLLCKIKKFRQKKCYLGRQNPAKHHPS